MTRIVHPLGPVARRDARVLILGSMPGGASLAARRYYAHPRNQFWQIMGGVVGAGPDLPYRRRLARLRARRVALWDVVGSCRRLGSLDADIRDAIPNDIAGLLRRCPRIHTIFCNGQTAAKMLRRLLGQGAGPRPVRMVTLPSTSPAHAGRSLAQKRRAWRRVRQALAADQVGARPVMSRT